MSAGPVRILCIEDNAMNWRLVQRLLSQAGYEMHWAEDGLKGCEQALALKPALILLDINLPGLSGFEVATKLRQMPDLDATLIVALTAKTLRSDRETALVTGCNGFISKPIDPFLFVSQVESYLGGQRDRLEVGREGVALRQFSQQVVEHLEAQLNEAREGNRKLLEAQSSLEQRSHHLSRLLALSKDIILVREPDEIIQRVLGELRELLHLDRARVYRLHPSGAYFQAYPEDHGDGGEIPVLPLDHPLVAWAEALPPTAGLLSAELRTTAAWDQGIHLGLWDPRAHALLLALRSRSGEDRLWGILAADRPNQPFLPFELELAAMHTGILQVSLENAELILHLDETSEALGTSYQGLEAAYESLKEAQHALHAQDRKTALGGLFLQMAQRLQTPVQILKAESQTLSSLMDRPAPSAEAERETCQAAMKAIHKATAQVDNLVRALLRRSGQGEANTPEWIHLHELLTQEVDLLLAEGSLTADLPMEVNLQATRDLIYGVYLDFSEVLGHLFAHIRAGTPRHLQIRSWGGISHFRLEVEDDGGLIRPERLARAFEPFSTLRTEMGDDDDRKPGLGLPHCAQLLSAYGGTVTLHATERGTLVRINLPME